MNMITKKYKILNLDSFYLNCDDIKNNYVLKYCGLRL